MNQITANHDLWNQQVAKSHANMMVVADGESLPRFYKDDLTGHQKTMDSYPQSEFLWLLRVEGSVMVPIKRGIHPAYVTEYLGRGPCFLVNPSSDRIEAVSKDTAFTLIHEPPAELRQCQTVDELIDVVSKTLSEWEVFIERHPDVSVLPVDWPKWLGHFEQADNNVMVRFLTDATNLLIKKKSS